MHSPMVKDSKELDIREKGKDKDGEVKFLERRLYLQLQVFTGCKDIQAPIKKLAASGLEGVLYKDVNDPQGIAVLIIAEDPKTFVEETSELYLDDSFSLLTHKPNWTMFGRTYSTGREMDIEDWMLAKPKRAALNPEEPWAIWYPLRRKPEFELLEPQEKGKILMEHGMIGRSYGQAGFAKDIRLACYGIDTHDNEFVLGLIGKELYPLSRLVQDMRKTQQTSKYMASLGPFFVGKVMWQSEYKAS